MTTDDDTAQDASDRLFDDRRAVEESVCRIMDSITGAWEAQGRLSVPYICSAAGTIIEATGRLGHALEKAALEIQRRAEDCYIDRLGEQTDATHEIRGIAIGLLDVAQDLRAFHDRSTTTTQALGSIGERER